MRIVVVEPEIEVAVHQVFRAGAESIIVIDAIDAGEAVVGVAGATADDEIAQQLVVLGRRNDGVEITGRNLARRQSRVVHILHGARDVERDRVERCRIPRDLGADVESAQGRVYAVAVILLEQLTGRTLPESVLFESATVPQLAESIVRGETVSLQSQNLLIEVQPGAGRPPFVFVDGDFWGGGYYTRKIARLLGAEYPFYDLRSHGLRDSRIPTVEALARDYLPLVRRAQPHGPYRIGGHCNGALAALSLASLLEASGEEVKLVVLVEPITLNARPTFRLLARSLATALRLTTADAARRQERLSAAMSIAWRAIRKANRLRRHQRGPIRAGDDFDALTRRIRKFDAAAAERYARLQDQYRRIMAGYLPAAIKGEIFCIIAESHEDDIAFAGDVFRRLAARSETAVIPGEHMTCITTHAEALTRLVRERLHALDARLSVDASRNETTRMR